MLKKQLNRMLPDERMLIKSRIFTRDVSRIKDDIQKFIEMCEDHPDFYYAGFLMEKIIKSKGVTNYLELVSELANGLLNNGNMTIIKMFRNHYLNNTQPEELQKIFIYILTHFNGPTEIFIEAVHSLLEFYIRMDDAEYFEETFSYLPSPPNVDEFNKIVVSCVGHGSYDCLKYILKVIQMFPEIKLAFTISNIVNAVNEYHYWYDDGLKKILDIYVGTEFSNEELKYALCLPPNFIIKCYPQYKRPLFHTYYRRYKKYATRDTELKFMTEEEINTTCKEVEISDMQDKLLKETTYCDITLMTQTE